MHHSAFRQSWRAAVRTLLIGSALMMPSLAMAQDGDHAGLATGLMASARFKVAKQALAGDYDRILTETVKLTEIPAPPFKEAARGRAFAEMLGEAGLADVTTDAEGNVYGIRKGTGNGPIIVVAAHLDTVFPEGTDVKVQRTADALIAPGVSDDTASLAVLLAFIRAIDAAGFRTKADIIFMGDVGEEGPGDLRGMRYLFTKGPLKGRIQSFISIEPGKSDVIRNMAVGSKRYRITFKGPGGHSYGAFGLVNPAYALGDAIVQIGGIGVPGKPKTTLNVGTVNGGTSVNSIPFSMTMEVDMRSEDPLELAKVERQVLAIPQRAVDRENGARATRKGAISYQAELIGDRPAGSTPPTVSLVRLAVAVAEAMGRKSSFAASSSDANLPMSLGIPAVTLGSGFESVGVHSLDERLLLDRPKNVEYMAAALATVLLAAEVQ
jgi:acetylornithine deacetylase/succinyl-diaminopimelate desuccinylase-like protein